MILQSLYRRCLPESVRGPVAHGRGAVKNGIRKLLRPFRSVYRPETRAFDFAWMTDANVRKMKIRLTALQGQYTGQRCFVMGNGPSLNQMDLELLRGEHVWAANRCSLLFERVSWRPGFYIAIDTRVVPDIADEINRLIETLKDTKFFFPLHFRLAGTLRSRRNVYWYQERHCLDRPHEPLDVFTPDASQWVSAARTVTVASLQLAAYLGFSPIYLIGCDTSYSVPATAEVGEENPDHLTSTRDDDPNHFDPRYFGAGRKWHEPHVERMIAHYEESKLACNDLGVDVFNATVGGKLEVFPRIDFEQLFSQ